MKNSRKLIFAALAIFLLIITAACSSSEGADTNKELKTDDTTDSIDETKTEDKHTINIAYGNQPGEPVDQLANKWKELAEEKSGNRLELKLYPSSQLGAEKDVVEQAIMGNSVIVMTGYDFLMDYVPDAGILTAPYLVDDFEELLYLTTTDWFDGIKSELNKANVDIISTKTFLGERHLMTSEKVLTPQDLKGMKIRVPSNQMSIKTFESMGATPTPTPLGDLYTSLQQGLVDGAENPLPTLQAVKTEEVVKHLTLTGHQKMIVAWIGGKTFIDTLPEDLVQILRETGDEAGDYAKEIQDDQTLAVLEEFKVEGVEVYEIDTELFKENVQDVYNAFPSWTPGLYDKIQELLEER